MLLHSGFLTHKLYSSCFSSITCMAFYRHDFHSLIKSLLSYSQIDILTCLLVYLHLLLSPYIFHPLLIVQPVYLLLQWSSDFRANCLLQLTLEFRSNKSMQRNEVCSWMTWRRGLKVTNVALGLAIRTLGHYGKEAVLDIHLLFPSHTQTLANNLLLPLAKTSSGCFQCIFNARFHPNWGYYDNNNPFHNPRGPPSFSL